MQYLSFIYKSLELTSLLLPVKKAALTKNGSYLHKKNVGILIKVKNSLNEFKKLIFKDFKESIANKYSIQCDLL